MVNWLKFSGIVSDLSELEMLEAPGKTTEGNDEPRPRVCRAALGHLTFTCPCKGGHGDRPTERGAQGSQVRSPVGAQAALHPLLGQDSGASASGQGGGCSQERSERALSLLSCLVGMGSACVALGGPSRFSEGSITALSALSMCLLQGRPGPSPYICPQ